MQDNDLSRLVGKSELCERFNFSERTLENMVKQGVFPPAVRIGKHVYWSERALKNWQHQQFSAQEAWTPRAGSTHVFM
ncbi:hypothetical protein WK80_15960 [Burkholderia multivorans]|uniref:helix-turn-helix transcriptional regulator n=1 Tax=Burkholderia multivorans TaxID=87883 RepID=UPI00075519FF|nr:helix-turn-helix domain-containing protein [Burkholderia multivorans]KVV26856.1 hypothetical protein WK80_15960 [Burkholderia multivorans]